MSQPKQILHSIPLMLSAMIVSIAHPTPSHAGWFGPSTFDECVIDKAEEFGNPSKDLLRIIANDCRSKFPAKPPTPQPMKLEDCGYNEAIYRKNWDNRSAMDCYDKFGSALRFNLKHDFQGDVVLTPADCNIPRKAGASFIGPSASDISEERAQCEKYNVWVKKLNPNQ